MSKVPDFTESELDLIHQTLKDRCEKAIKVQLADAEIILRPSEGDNEPGDCVVTLLQMQVDHERDQILSQSGD